MNQDFSRLRREYLHASLSEADMNADPIKQFEKWFGNATEAGLDLPNAMSLATAGKDGKPGARVVLLKDFDEDGFVFYTHAISPKGDHLRGNPRATLLFYWAALDRQIRINGTVDLVSAAEADEYFNSRPYSSRLGAWVAPQSSVIENREFMDSRMRELEQEYENKDVPRPQDWVGYRVCPETIEFWQGRESRLHDRFQYSRATGDDWCMQRLAP